MLIPQLGIISPIRTLVANMLKLDSGHRSGFLNDLNPNVQQREAAILRPMPSHWPKPSLALHLLLC